MTLTAEDIELAIDKEFQELIPPHSKEQLADLKESVEATGRFLDPIRYWTCGDRHIIIDGHTRYGIWCKLPDDTLIPPPRVEEMTLADREAVLNWIEMNQLGRRNLDPKQLSYIRGRMYQRRRGDKGGARPNSGRKNAQNIGNNSSAQNEHLNRAQVGKAAKEVAKETGVGQATVRRDAAYVESLDVIGKINSKARADILSGALNIPKKDVVAIGKLDKEGVAAAIKNVKSGKDWKPQASIVKDKSGREVPDYLKEKQGLTPVLQSWATKLEKLKTELGELSGQPGAEFLDIEVAQVLDMLSEAKDTVRGAMFFCECPRCQGDVKKSCDRCGGHGYLPAARSQTLSKADKDYLAGVAS